MAVDVRLVTTALVICAANVALAQQQTRCSYMREIPRPPTPDFPDKDYDFSGYSWTERPLLPPEFREEVCMDGFNRFGSTGTQLIYMEEEIEGEVVIARLNYRGNAVPFILPGSGALNLLGPVIKRIPDFTGDWHLVITEKQDYESPSMSTYMFTVAVEGESMRPLVALEIVNIDDNAPIVQVFGPCHIAENEKQGLTSCTYIVSDADGRISTSAMTFELESDRNDNEFFGLFARNEPNEWMWMHLTLELKGELNFAENALHIFRVTARDSLPNNHTVTVMVEVENVESRPPRWVEILAMARFDEKIPQEFSVRAVDGDTGINRAIEYRLRTEPEDTFFHITTLAGGGALFNVDAIDRDALEREVFQLSIIAFKTDNEGKEYSTSTNVVIIVDDINDQKPEPYQEVYTIDILEETAMTLNLENFGFHDRDLGQHAQYKVELVAVNPTGAVAGFQVAPQTGYQRQNFIMTTLNHELLDYDMIEDGVPTYQNIILRVVATDLNDTTHVGVATVHVNLINWNDELPIFEQDTRTVRFRETVEAGYFVAVMRAHDRDIGDRILYQLLGNAGNYLQIDVNTGAITVSFDDAFDYHRQNEHFIQVQAVDTLGDGPYHSATSQLVIELIDVNNTPPSIRLPRTRPEVEENVPEGFPIPAEITATDPDTDAELMFEIDWSTSYATKQGRETPAVEFHGCVEIQTTYPDPDNKRSAVGKLIVKEIKQGVTIDFEEFEVLYVTVRVRDLKTEIGLDFDEATFTIIIVDMNDNSPVWVEGSLSQAFRVREKSDAGVVIGSVTATDIDGPLYNQVRYTIFPRKDTPDDLVAINFVTGQLTVKLPDAIDADVPPRYHLFYTLRASDECSAENSADCSDPTINYEDGDIEISILDTNNKVPYLEVDKFKQKVFVYENETTGFVIERIVASDLDRDEIYHTLNYQIDFRVNPRLRNFFAMDTKTGVITVNYTTDETLDRDGDEPTHTIFFIIQDNFLREGDGNSNQDDSEIEVILLDVNDNAPELPPSDQLSWIISENTPIETRLQPHIFAPDRDEPDTDNSRVGYAILSLTVTNRDFEAPELFTMVQIENVTGELETARHLQGYWGTYDIHILAYDHGHPQQKSEETYSLVISVYNFHHPVFVFPQPGTVIRLARERIAVNGLLVKVNQDFLERIEATDDDGELAGIATFEVDGSTSTNAEAAEYFRVVNDAENSGALILLKTFEENIRPFTVTIRATDGGTDPHPRYSDVTFTLVFVPTQGEPVFEEHTITVSFVEGDDGMEESFELPHAIDDKNHLCEDDCHTTYYTIVEGNTDGHFSLEPRTNTLYLAHPLDRSESATHTVQLVATNSPDSLNVLSSNTLTVTVNVREANPRPRFERELYTAGISTQDVIQRALLTVKAIHTEETDITYTIDSSTMEVDSSLEAVKDNAFMLNASTGVLTLNIQPTASMHGMFEFQVVATDPNGAYDRTDVKIFLISALNRVFFRFRNTLQHIEAHIDFIEQTFTAGFRMTCNIDQVVPATDATTGAVIPELVEVRAHFIREDLPVPATEIESLRGDVTLLGMIQTTLDRELVVLEDFVTDISPGQSDNTQITVYVLIGITVLLGLVCLVLLVVYCVRIRTLNRRLQALSTTKYGSVDSGLNRMGITAPGTNKHAVEGSNPIWNEAINAPNFDALSNASNDSDLIGVEDLPQFRNDYFPPASDMELAGSSRNEPVSSHNNNFGFSASPFSPEFGNSNLRR